MKAVTFPALVLLFSSSAIAVKEKPCVVQHKDGQDDTESILSAFKKCRNGGTVLFEEGIDYNAWTPVQFHDLKDVMVQISGNIHLPSDIPTVQAKINATTNPKSTYATPWFYFQGTNVEITGSEKPQWGRFYGYGEQWWHQSNRILRPQLATFNVTNGVLRNLKVIKPVAWGWNVPGANVRIYDHYVDAAPENTTRIDSVGFPFNTDGFNLSGKNITLDGYYGHNGDDCVSVVNGARGIVAKNGFCGFSSHGLSIGSLGREGAAHTVEDVVFENWVMEGAVYGARFKSWTGGNGYAKNVVWRNIKTVNVSTPIFITQNYYDQDKGPRPPNTNKTSTRIEGMRFENFVGYISPEWTDGTCISDPCWNFIDGIKTATNGIIFDLYNGTAKGIVVKKVNLHPYHQSVDTTTAICDPTTLAPGEEKTLGFKCVRGPLEVL